MTPNHKLTQVIKGRKIVGTSNADGKMTVTFDDGSTMKIKTGASSSDTSSTRSDSGTLATAVKSPDTLTALSAKRNDVFRNVKWSEEKFATDATRLNSQGNTAHAEIIDAAIPATSSSVSSNSASTGGTVQSVMQGETAMTLQFEDGSKLEIPLAEATSSVMLRDKDNTMEYAD